MKVVDTTDFEGFSPIFRGEKGRRRAEFVMRKLAIDKVNWVYDHSGSYTGAEFAGRLLNDVGVNYVVGNAERLKMLPEGAFITIANHPYGGLDGIILINMIAGIRPDYKLMVNELISRVKTMKENFIPVTPTGNKKKPITSVSINGIKETIRNLRNGHPVGFFPSGAVSDFSLREMRIRDRKWQDSILHVIHKMRVPVLPIRFFDLNSKFFYFLGLINWRIRTLRIPTELFNKRNQKSRIGIGNIVTVQEQEKYNDPESLGDYLRRSVYEMPLPQIFVPHSLIQIP
ncbi:MAG: 1-acyl-sn-glycerol-3-phosphate acyltransferase [Bacteroidota bacterium]|nr:1-acyl-sn-glycerol-3-phosphate acyltransferase [Bacteroidota bacterium]